MNNYISSVPDLESVLSKDELEIFLEVMNVLKGKNSMTAKLALDQALLCLLLNSTVD